MSPTSRDGSVTDVLRLGTRAASRLRATVRDAHAEDRADAHDLATQVNQLVACTLVHLGYPDVAHLALREALILAAAGNPPRLTDLARRMGSYARSPAARVGGRRTSPGRANVVRKSCARPAVPGRQPSPLGCRARPARR